MSPAPASASPSARSPLRSISQYTRAHSRLTTHSSTAIHSAACHPNRFAVAEAELKLNSVPSRAIASVTPKLRASSLPRNQRASMAFWVTMSDSEPAPNMKRPAMATSRLGASATMAAPMATTAASRMPASRVPMRSAR